MSKELELFKNIEKALAEKYELSVGAYENLINIEKSLKALEIIRKCLYVAKSSDAILLTSYGFEHEDELKEALKDE